VIIGGRVDEFSVANLWRLDLLDVTVTVMGTEVTRGVFRVVSNL
jgi:hypothetical protein